MASSPASCSYGAPGGPGVPGVSPPQFVLLDYVFPGFSVFSAAVKAYLGIDLQLYIPLVLIISGLAFSWTYISEFVWELAQRHLMSTVRIRADDEVYNMVMSWVAAQRFSQGSRRFIVNTSVNSRSWFLWDHNADDAEEDSATDGSNLFAPQKKPLQYTPAAQGTHYFWYGGRLLIFERHENREQSGYLSATEREEITISSFGRNPSILKDLLIEARAHFMKKDESKTLIYRASNSAGGEPGWQRCMTRESRPLSTVILNEKVKKDLIDDVTDYLNPATRRWYANRGIPYRRGYLLYGPPGTGKSSLSLALSGFFQMKIYMVSLSSSMANEENLSHLFAELPRRCVVLLEDIDSAGLTHTRESNKSGNNSDDSVEAAPVAVTTSPTKSRAGGKVTAVPAGRLSLSGLLNILDGVASQEGRVLIMTTNHREKLDKALIRPGRVDMIVNFGLADAGMTASIFRAIYAPYEGEQLVGANHPSAPSVEAELDEEKAKALAQEAEKARAETVKRIGALAEKFAARVPENEFSPAEIQGLLLKNKRDPEGVIDSVAEWIADTRIEKKQKEIEDAQTRRKEEEKRRKELAKKKKNKDKKSKGSAKGGDSDPGSGSDSGSNAGSGSSSGSGSGSDSNSGSEADEPDKQKKTKKSRSSSTKKFKRKDQSKKNESDSTPASSNSTSYSDSDIETQAKKPLIRLPTGEEAREPKTMTITSNDEDKMDNKTEAQEDKSTASTDSGYATPSRAV